MRMPCTRRAVGRARGRRRVLVGPARGPASGAGGAPIGDADAASSPGRSAGSAPGSTSTTTARSSRGHASVAARGHRGVGRRHGAARGEDAVPPGGPGRHPLRGLIVDRRLVGNILRRAHRHGVQVVAWYLPHFADVDRDLRHVRAMYEFRSRGERFDGIALDLEWTSDVKDPAKRNRRADRALGSDPQARHADAARRDRARAGAARGREHRVLAGLPVEEAASSTSTCGCR